MTTISNLEKIVKGNIIGIQPDAVLNTAFEIIKCYDEKLVEGNCDINANYIILEQDLISIFYDCLSDYDTKADEFSDGLKNEDKLFNTIAEKVYSKYFVCD